MDKPRIIGIRVQPDEYERLDNLRHTHKTTWQGLVLDFLRQWADAGSTARSVPTERIPSATAVEIPSSFTKEDRDAVETFIEMLATDRGKAWSFLPLLKLWRGDNPKRVPSSGRHRTG